MTKFADDLIASLQDAVAHTSGEVSNVRAQRVAVPDLKAIRQQLRNPDALK